MTKPIGGAPPTPPGKPSKAERVKTLSNTFAQNLGKLIDAMRAIITNPHLADSKPALTELANAIKTIDSTSKEAANFKE